MATLIRRTTSMGERPKYRVWRAWNLPHNMDFYAVESPEEARSLIEELATADLADEAIVSNAFGLEELEDGEYSEWCDEDGNDIQKEA